LRCDCCSLWSVHLLWGGIGLEFQPRLSLSCLFFAILTQQSFPRTFRAKITVIIIFPCRLFTVVWIWDPHFISLRTRPPFHRERAQQQQRYVAHSNAVACKRKEIIASFPSFLVFVTSSATHSLILHQPIRNSSTSIMDKRTPTFGRSVSMPLFQQAAGEQNATGNDDVVREEQYSELQHSPGFQSFRDQQARVWSSSGYEFAGSPRMSISGD
jgi:hypothetical protein